jgi:NAD(P)-dependent dehydrogenase (short-subunit alcohol dehydrogenase family)
MPTANELFDLSGEGSPVDGREPGACREMVLLAEAGADVIASRKLESCETLAQEVVAKTGRKALPVACHVADWTQVEQLAETAYGHFGKWMCL